MTLAIVFALLTLSFKSTTQTYLKQELDEAAAADNSTPIVVSETAAD